MALRQYQSDDKANILEALTQYNSVLYQLPTGGGKSVVMTSVIEDFKDKNIIVFAHKRTLLLQLRDHFKKIGITAGVLAGSFEENLDSSILIVSIRTAVKDARLEKILEKDWDMAMIDEARNSRTKSYDKVLDALREKHPNYKLFGVDATPYRKDKKRLDKHFQTLICSNETTESLMAQGFLQRCKTIVSPINIEELQEEVKENSGDYQMQSLSAYMRKPKYLEYMVSQYVKYGEGRQNLVFAVDIEHAKDLQQMYEDNGFENQVSRVDSTMSEAEIVKALSDFEQCKIRHLINVEMITEGVDLPITGCITGGRPTKSLTLYLQMGGRGTRLDGMFDYFILLDCCGWTEEYGVIATKKHWSLNPEIDPNGARLTNKIFGKHPVTGELVEDLTDFIGEVIEMTPEEYLQNLQGGKERAEQINVSIDDKIKNLFEAILKLIMIIEGIYKDYDVEFDYDNTYIRRVKFFHKSSIESEWSRMRAELIFDSRGKKHEIYAQMVGSYDGDKRFQFLKLTKLVGELNAKLFKDDKDTITFKSFELIEQISDLNKSKINLEQFRRAEEAHKEEQFIKTVEDHTKLIGRFDLPNKLTWGHFFKESYNTHMSGNIVAIDIPARKINNHQNTIMLSIEVFDQWITTKEGKSIKAYKIVETEKKYIKGEKIIEMLQSSKWQVEVQN